MDAFVALCKMSPKPLDSSRRQYQLTASAQLNVVELLSPDRARGPCNVYKSWIRFRISNIPQHETAS